MKKFDPDETRSANILTENIERLKTLFPEAVIEGKIDIDVLKQLLGDFVATRELKRMVDDGYLILSGTGRGAHYLPVPGLAGLLNK